MTSGKPMGLVATLNAIADGMTEPPDAASIEEAATAWKAAREQHADHAKALLEEAAATSRWMPPGAIRAAMARRLLGERGERAMLELWRRWQQLELGTISSAPQPAAAGRLRVDLEARRAAVLAGGDPEALVVWACGEVPWLARVLGDEPEPPRRLWVPPPPPVPAPTPAHAAVAARILRGDVAR